MINNILGVSNHGCARNKDLEAVETQEHHQAEGDRDR